MSSPSTSDIQTFPDLLMCGLNGLAADILTLAELVTRQVMYIVDLQGQMDVHSHQSLEEVQHQENATVTWGDLGITCPRLPLCCLGPSAKVQNACSCSRVIPSAIFSLELVV